MQDKKHLRKWAKELRKYMEKEDEELTALLMQSSFYKNAKNVLIFYPLKYEVNLLALLKDRSKNFFLPKVDGENLLCCPYKDGDKLSLSSFNTQEPLSRACDKNLIDLAIIPALCCDKNNYRLGYGGGYYDRFLKDFRGKKVVCISRKLIVETVYPEEYDIPVDEVITIKNC